MARARSARRKRASATDLYKTCKQAGTCPPDVVQKIERTTPADKILQYGSLGVFFGGLGIGTGSGTGGRTGYVPLRTAPRPSSTLPRPPIPPEVVPPAEGGLVTSNDPSLIPLVDLSAPTTSMPDVPTVGVAESGVLVTADTPLVTRGVPGITVSGGEPPPAVLDVGPSPGNGATPRITQSTFHNPVFHAGAGETGIVGESSWSAHTVVSVGGPHNIAEEIPLLDLGPRSSTPLAQVTKGFRAFPYYSRGLDQVPISLGRLYGPGSVQDIANPAYDPEGSLVFDPSDAADLRDPAFLDIVALHRPALTSRRGVVRMSRLGTKASTVLRSGRRVGPRVHFYADISSIDADTTAPSSSILSSTWRGPSLTLSPAAGASAAGERPSQASLPRNTHIYWPGFPAPHPGIAPRPPPSATYPGSPFFPASSYFWGPEWLKPCRKHMSCVFADGLVAP
nr:L2 [Firstpapillomavirinae PV-HMU-2]